MADNLTIGKVYLDNKQKFELKSVTGKIGFNKEVKTMKMNRPGLELTGFWEYFQKDRILLLGMKEKCYLDSISKERIYEIFEKIFKIGVPGAIFAHDTHPTEDIVKLAKKYKIALFTSKLLTTRLNQFMMEYLDWNLASRTVMHGTLVDIYGVGILFTGRSGIGKSEIALDLVERGHRLVSDDSVRIIRRSDNVIIGTGHKFFEYYIEIRGLGIIDVARMLGVRAIRKQKRVEVQVELEDWVDKKNYERIGAVEKTRDILQVPIPLINLPIYPGKNITVITEAIAMNHLLKVYGLNAAKKFEERLEFRIKEKTIKKNLETYLRTDFE